MPVSKAQFVDLLAAEATVTTDTAALLADTTTQTTKQAAFAAGLAPGEEEVFIPDPPAVGAKIITQDSTVPQGFTVRDAGLLS